MLNCRDSLVDMLKCKNNSIDMRKKKLGTEMLRCKKGACKVKVQVVKLQIVQALLQCLGHISRCVMVAPENVAIHR
jgi:hypothetical protein